VAWKVVESPYGSRKSIGYTKIDEDGKTIAITKTLKDASAITSSEAVSGGNWTRTYKEKVSDLVAYEVTEVRPIPGNPIVEEKIDEDGKPIISDRQLKEAATIAITEVISAGYWTKTESKAVSDLVAWEVITARQVPGNPIPSTKLADDGVEIDTVKTLKDQTTITTSETLVAGIWKKVSKEAVSDLVAWEVVEGARCSGYAVPSAKVAGDDQVATVASTLNASSAITPSATESGGTITTVEKKEVSDLVSEQIVTSKPWLDSTEYSISIANVIPEVFRAQIPTTNDSSYPGRNSFDADARDA